MIGVVATVEQDPDQQTRSCLWASSGGLVIAFSVIVAIEHAINSSLDPATHY